MTGEVYEKITIDRLTKESVSIVKNSFIMLNGVETKIGGIWRRAYENNHEQRTDMANLLGENSIEYSVITQLWIHDKRVYDYTNNRILFLLKTEK